MQRLLAFALAGLLTIVCTIQQSLFATGPESGLRNYEQGLLPTMLATARRVIRDEHLAEDCVQRVFMSLQMHNLLVDSPEENSEGIRTLKLCDGSYLRCSGGANHKVAIHSPRSYVLRAVMNQALSMQAERRNEPANLGEMDVAVESVGSESLDCNWFDEQFEVAKRVLSGMEVCIIDLRMNGIKHSEIATTVGMSEASVRKKFARAVEQMRIELEARISSERIERREEILEMIRSTYIGKEKHSVPCLGAGGE